MTENVFSLAVRCIFQETQQTGVDTTAEGVFYERGGHGYSPLNRGTVVP
jgi:hypothetical protein